MQPDTKTQGLKRLKRIEGQVRGLMRMLEEDRYCIDIVTQIAAIQGALSRVQADILEDHIGHCVEQAIQSGDADDQRQKIRELVSLLGPARR